MEETQCLAQVEDNIRQSLTKEKTSVLDYYVLSSNVLSSFSNMTQHYAER